MYRLSSFYFPSRRDAVESGDFDVIDDVILACLWLVNSLDADKSRRKKAPVGNQHFYSDRLFSLFSCCSNYYSLKLERSWNGEWSQWIDVGSELNNVWNSFPIVPQLFRKSSQVVFTFLLTLSGRFPHFSFLTKSARLFSLLNFWPAMEDKQLFPHPSIDLGQKGYLFASKQNTNVDTAGIQDTCIARKIATLRRGLKGERGRGLSESYRWGGKYFWL